MNKLVYILVILITCLLICVYGARGQEISADEFIQEEITIERVTRLYYYFLLEELAWYEGYYLPVFLPDLDVLC